MNLPSSPKLQPCGVFSSRDTLAEALDYSNSLIATLPIEHRSTAMTALWVTLNTAIKISEETSLANVPLLPRDQLPDGVPVAEMSPKTAALLVRSVLLRSVIQMKTLYEVLPEFAEPQTVVLLLVSRMFGLTVDDLTSEVLTQHGKRGD